MWEPKSFSLNWLLRLCKVDLRRPILQMRKECLRVCHCFSNLIGSESPGGLHKTQDANSHHQSCWLSRFGVDLKMWIANSFLGGDALHLGPHCGNHWYKVPGLRFTANKLTALLGTYTHLCNSCLAVTPYYPYCSTSVVRLKLSGVLSSFD